MTKSPPVDGSPVDFLVNRSALGECRLVAAQPVAADALRPGQVLLRIDKFGLSANNITYAVLGDAMGYWGFFPAPEGWGRIPVWGYADVLQSNHPDVAPGDRFYGYYPMSSQLVVQFGPASGLHFNDISPHRVDLLAAYNRYTRTPPGTKPSARADDLQVVFRPLFNTSFLLDDFLADNQFFGARNLVIASASSKTALGLAFLLSRRRERPAEIIGLTSPENAAFVQRSGFYDRTVSYDELESIPSDLATVFVDMAGNGAVVRDIHKHLGDNLAYSCKVGLTHWDAVAAHEPAPVGVLPVLFFAPMQAQKRVRDWGAPEFAARSDAAWGQLTEMASACIDILHAVGPESVRSLYLALLNQRPAPDRAHVLSWSTHRAIPGTPLQTTR